jgi:hypothetical protein
MCAQVPTTVMGAVDASVGIKTAVNFDNKKNKLGTYCPPLAVFIDRCGAHPLVLALLLLLPTLADMLIHQRRGMPDV